jgi:limonene-1,2-epoxide hydrolase
MRPRELVQKWVQLFNQGSIDELISLYAPSAVNHQVVTEPLCGREEIRGMFKVEFGRATMTCPVENIFEDGEWAILEWRDPKGLRGCGFFQIRNDQIIFQRGYFDQLSFFRQQGISMTEKYLGPGE